jgi:hypothetical protein
MGWMSWHDVFSSDVCVDQYRVIVGDHNTRPMGMGQQVRLYTHTLYQVPLTGVSATLLSLLAREIYLF